MSVPRWTGTTPTPNASGDAQQQHSFPRVGSPSGLGSFLSKPSKWFTRSNSNLKAQSQELAPRPSISSSRRPIISQPTDPRPLLEVPKSSLNISHSYHDLALTRNETSRNAPPSTPPSPWASSSSSLAAISRKSRSVDDLSKFSNGEDSNLTARINAYKAPDHLPPSPIVNKSFKFPTITTTAPSENLHDSSTSSISSITRPRSQSHSVASSPPLISPVNRPPVPSPTVKAPLPFPPSASKLLEPEKPSEPSNRTSQIVHLTGFLNQHPSPSASSIPSLAKGWTPMKAVLKGTKLFFYKPPKDRMHDIKDLFPAGIIVEVPKTSMTPAPTLNEVSRTPRKDSNALPRKRAYWGRETHPELVLISGRSVIEKGTLDALLHEATFATTFAEPPGDTLTPTPVSDEWKSFASVIILCLPYRSFMDRPVFESELRRRITHLLDGSAEDELALANERAQWLIQTYHDHWGPPFDDVAWGSWLAETFIDYLPPSGPSTPSPAAIPLPQSPLPPGTPTASSSTSQKSRKVAKARSQAKLWTALEKEGFSVDIFGRLDYEKVAYSLKEFNRSQVRELKPQQIRTSSIFEFLEPSQSNAECFIRLSLLCGSDARPHWLTRLILSQILASSSAPPVDESRSLPQLSRTHARADCLGRWIAVGEYARVMGDHCTWNAIKSAVCCKAIARLEKVWRRVAHKERKLVEGWVVEKYESEPREPRSSCWLGDVVERACDALTRCAHAKDSEDRWNFESFSEVREHIINILEELKACSDAVISLTEGPEGEAAALFNFWQNKSVEGTSKPMSLDQYTSLSYAAEPRQKSLFAQSFWKPPHDSFTHPLQPLAFVEPLPVASLLDRTKLLQPKNEPFERHPHALNSYLGEIPESHFRLLIDSSSPYSADNPRDSVEVQSVGHSTTHSEKTIGDTFMHAFDGELILKVLPGRYRRPSRSRSRSRAASLREDTESCAEPVESSSLSALQTGLQRKPSLAPSVRAAMSTSVERRPSSRRSRRTSLPSLSRPSSLHLPDTTADLSVRVVVSGGTLDRLVDLLLDGLEVAVEPTDDIGLSAGKTRIFSIDHEDFSSTWWSTFRSFVSPYVFFELLCKRYGQRNNPFKHLDGSDRDDTGPHLDAALRVLITMEEWITGGGGATDLLDDLQLYTAFRSFLDRLKGTSASGDHPALAQSMHLQQSLASLTHAFHSQTQRPNLKEAREPKRVTSSYHFPSTPPDIDKIGVEELVVSLDAIASAVLSAVTTSDMLTTSDILEVQTSDRLGWYPSKDLPTSLDEVALQNVYSLAQNVEPSVLAAELGSYDVLQRTFPPSIRMLFRCHAILRKWVTYKITTPGIGLRVREDRVHLILRAVEFCRSQSMLNESSDTPMLSQARVRSFVEAALVAALCSPESRTYAKMWHKVAATRGASSESLMSLISYSPPTDSVQSLTADGGWLLERLLELISLPDTLAGEHILINFDKRRYISTLASGIPRFTFRPPQGERIHIERMNNMFREIIHTTPDLRALREDAHRESLQIALSSTSKRLQRPFQTLVTAQAEKIRRDRHIRDRLSKEKKAEQQKSDRREGVLSRAMNQPKRSGLTPRHERGKRSMSAFFRVVRPLSTAFSSERMEPPIDVPRRTTAELDFIPNSKPSLVLSLNDASVALYPNKERSYIFRLDTGDGGRWLLQAPSTIDLTAWVDAISRTAEKRLTRFGADVRPQFNDIVETGNTSQPLHDGAVFGISLDSLVQRGNHKMDTSSSDVPFILEQCLSEVERRGLTEVGIYRISGGTGAINTIRNTYNEGLGASFPQQAVEYFETQLSYPYLGSIPDFASDERFADIHGICGAVKLFLRQLPDPVIPFYLYHEAIESSRIVDYDQRFTRMRELVHSMPTVHFACLRRIMEHLDRVTDYEESNQMTAEALAICFSPSLLQPPPGPASFGVGIGNMGFAMSFTKSLILQFHRIFDQLDIDVEQGGRRGSQELGEEEEGAEENESSAQYESDGEIVGPMDPTVIAGQSLEPSAGVLAYI